MTFREFHIKYKYLSLFSERAKYLDVSKRVSRATLSKDPDASRSGPRSVTLR